MIYLNPSNQSSNQSKAIDPNQTKPNKTLAKGRMPWNLKKRFQSEGFGSFRQQGKNKRKISYGTSVHEPVPGNGAGNI